MSDEPSAAPLLPFNQLLRLGTHHVAQAGEATQEYDAATEAFRAAHGGPDARLAIFPRSGLGVYLTPDGVFRWSVLNDALTFDWSDALRLLYRIDAVAEQARDWWPPDDVDRQAILERAYTIATAILAAVDRENLRHPESEGTEPLVFSARYTNNLALLIPEIERAEAILYKAAQRKTQGRYGRGMLVGTALVAGVCLVLGAIFYAFDTPAEFGVALPAGAAGALVSVLQRMTSGRLQLDVHAGSRTTLAYGALRPIIGGIFGVVLFILFEGGLLPSIDVAEEVPLAFYAAIGFLGGFNERWAQDMLAGSAKPLSGVQPVGAPEALAPLVPTTESTPPASSVAARSERPVV